MLYEANQTGYGTPTLLDNGTVAFLTSYGFSIVKGNGGPLEIVADNTGGLHSYFGGPGQPNFVDSGKFAFIGQPKVSFGPVILTGPDLVADKVWRAGEGLFGLKGGGFAMHNGLNESGQIAFLAQFFTSQGLPHNMIVRADPVPEPATWLLALLGIASAAVVRIRRQHCSQ
jgi:hypothetical protein